jgi:thiol-disulfide isomerase/thioredoxin
MSRLTAGAVVVGLALALGPGAALGAGDADVKLQGRGDRRQALDELSYKPFDASLLDGLASWTNGPVSASSLKGRPAVIYAWAGWFRPSLAGLAEAQRLAGLPENKDLAVVLVHHANNYESAAEALEKGAVKLPSAHDAEGKLFKALKVDGPGPAFYVVDRAGNLRFADVARASLPAAVKIVVDESAEDAAKAPARAKEAKKTGEAEAAGTPLGGPNVKDRPAAEDYAKAKWPAKNKAVQHARNVQGKPLPVAFGKEKWLTEKQETAGKVIVLDFWATWCGPCVAAAPILDKIQAKHKGSAVVIGVGGQGEDEATIKGFLKKSKHGYAQVFDASQKVYSSLGIEGIPHVVVLSTDGVVRWQGNPHEPGFAKAVDDVVAADPWVQRDKKG